MKQEQTCHSCLICKHINNDYDMSLILTIFKIRFLEIITVSALEQIKEEDSRKKSFLERMAKIAEDVYTNENHNDVGFEILKKYKKEEACEAFCLYLTKFYFETKEKNLTYN